MPIEAWQRAEVIHHIWINGFTKSKGVSPAFLDRKPAQACDTAAANSTKDKYAELLLKMKDVVFVSPTRCKKTDCIRVGISSEAVLLNK